MRQTRREQQGARECGGVAAEGERGLPTVSTCRLTGQLLPDGM